ncbi:GAF domain-containing sensor histidine kinase [Streptantibioticus silvisoli]|uniref:GAF domain-containing sensor histidine kinase n=1 Tax=Streptantibioticus silvisoli TaxID=2705255 RepID=UPI0035565A38
MSGPAHDATPPGTAPDTARDRINAISSAVLAMSRHRQVRDVLQTIVSSARELIGARYAALGVPDDHGGFAQFVVDGVTDEQWKAIGPLPRQHGILAVMLHEATTQRLADVRRHPRFEGWPKEHPEMSDFLGMPVTGDGEVLGAIFLAGKESPAGRTTAAREHDGADPEHGGGNAPGDPGEAYDGSGDAPDGPREAPAATPVGPGFTADDEELLRTLAAHAALALTNARLHERSRELTLAGERARIAHGLHDAVSQKLFSLRLTAQAAAALVDRDPARAKQELREVARLAAEAADELRAVVVELRPAALEEDGLIAALRSQTDVLDRAHAARVTFTGRLPHALPAAQEEAVLRVAQEALHNALRHAAAGRVAVELTGRGRGAVLRVTDDGRGFETTAVRRAGRHLGLVSMRDRATAVAGLLTVRSAPGEGTTIELEVPGG